MPTPLSTFLNVNLVIAQNVAIWCWAGRADREHTVREGLFGLG
jgi:hypothetical protein